MFVVRLDVDVFCHDDSSTLADEKNRTERKEKDTQFDVSDDERTIGHESIEPMRRGEFRCHQYCQNDSHLSRPVVRTHVNAVCLFTY